MSTYFDVFIIHKALGFMVPKQYYTKIVDGKSELQMVADLVNFLMHFSCRIYFLSLRPLVSTAFTF